MTGSDFISYYYNLLVFPRVSYDIEQQRTV